MASATLSAILAERYGVTVLTAPAYAILWAAERLMDEVGLKAARAALDTANRIRSRVGKLPVYPEYGTPLFQSADPFLVCLEEQC